MTKVGITDTILRDAHQSQAATRMTTKQMEPAFEQPQQGWLFLPGVLGRRDV